MNKLENDINKYIITGENLSFKEMQDIAYERFVKETGYKGNVHDSKKLDKQFKFSIEPVIDKNKQRVIGIEVSYTKKQKKPSLKKVAGSRSSTNYKF